MYICGYYVFLRLRLTLVEHKSWNWEDKNIIYILGQAFIMLYIKLYVILSILLVFDLFKLSCANLSGAGVVHSSRGSGRGGGSSGDKRKTFDTNDGKNGGIDLCSINCEYLF